MEAPRETLAYVAVLDPRRRRPDAIGVVDVDPQSPAYGRLIHQVDMPVPGDELHHFGWNACSSCLSPYAPHPHMQRRYLVVPGILSSAVHIPDTYPDPRAHSRQDDRRLRHRRPHGVLRAAHEPLRTGRHLLNALGSATGDGPGGLYVVDNETFEVRGPWERERGPQYLAYAI